MAFRAFQHYSDLYNSGSSSYGPWTKKWTSQTDGEQRKTLLQPCDLYSQLMFTYSQKCCFLLPHSGFVKHFLLHFTFPPSLSTKDNIDMSLHLQFRELTDWIMDLNELSLPLQLRGQWNLLFRLRNREEKRIDFPCRLLFLLPWLCYVRWDEISWVFLLFIQI